MIFLYYIFHTKTYLNVLEDFENDKSGIDCKYRRKGRFY